MTFRVHHRPVTESTNLDARRGRPGDVFTADEQTAGRGRLDHKWLSPAGANLMMSVVLDVADLPAEQVVTLPLVVGLAVHAAVTRFLPAALRVELKWPNDVYVADRKIAGILCERVGNAVIAGVGVNVNQTEFAPEIAARATSLAVSRGREAPKLDVARVCDALLEALGELFEMWRAMGFDPLYPRYAAVDWLKGRRIAVRQTDDDAQPLEGICEGVQCDGTLLVGGVPVYAGEAHILKSARE
ncbi:MAG: biotin--[acetyl-CoA-carboxylase] ligase [Kiritimatiellia bacterium]